MGKDYAGAEKRFRTSTIAVKEKVEPFKASSRIEPGPKQEDLTVQHAKESRSESQNPINRHAARKILHLKRVTCHLIHID